MKFVLTHAASGYQDEVIEVNSIEELYQLTNHESAPILIYPASDYVSYNYNYPVLKIYDDYLE